VRAAVRMPDIADCDPAPFLDPRRIAGSHAGAHRD
jgi:hypothetical protein